MDTPALSYVHATTIEPNPAPTLQGTAADPKAWDAIFESLDDEPDNELSDQTPKQDNQIP